MIISNRRIICHKFNEYFTNVADKLNKGKYKDFTPPSYTEFFFQSACRRIHIPNRSGRS